MIPVPSNRRLQRLGDGNLRRFWHLYLIDFGRNLRRKYSIEQFIFGNFHRSQSSRSLSLKLRKAWYPPFIYCITVSL